MADWLPNSFWDVKKMDFGSEFMKVRQTGVQNAMFLALGGSLEQLQGSVAVGPRALCASSVRIRRGRQISTW